jgi:hypothetical protein
LPFRFGCRASLDKLREKQENGFMKLLLFLAVWLLVFWVSWPLAILALLLLPILWIVSLPFRLLAIVVGAVFALIKAILFLPARLLGIGSRCKA